ncbi:MAG: HAD-IA family hydrolase [Gammaproteobacteria bacterium]
MVNPAHSKSPEDARLVEYVRNYTQLHPKVKADRKISRTDIFEVLFGDDLDAKQVAHKIFNHHYRNHFGTVLPFEPRVRQVLAGLRVLGFQLGVITNRDREFFEHEVNAVENGSWTNLFDVMICGDDTRLRKPNPDQLLLASSKLGFSAAPNVWYVGDSTTDVIASKRGRRHQCVLQWRPVGSALAEQDFPRQ